MNPGKLVSCLSLVFPIQASQFIMYTLCIIIASQGFNDILSVNENRQQFIIVMFFQKHMLRQRKPLDFRAAQTS